MSDFRLAPQPTPEERLILKLRDWQPESGFGEVTVKVIYRDGSMVEFWRIDGQERVRVG